MSKRTNSQIRSRVTCALTGNAGKFVKAHIIPQAFTRPTEKGAPLLQSTRGQGHHRRWSSWYDPNLVTEEGEARLAVIDGQAIRLLRKYQLTWDSWWLFEPVFQEVYPIALGHSFREITLTREEARSLHFFFVSVAWRAAASRLKDMSDVQLAPDAEDRLRRQLDNNATWDWKLTPVSLVQLSTLGEHHNLTPLLSEKVIPAYADKAESRVRFIRVYMCGLIAHVHHEGYEGIGGADEPLFLGGDSRLIITGVTYESSFQCSNLLTVAFESYLPTGQ